MKASIRRLLAKLGQRDSVIEKWLLSLTKEISLGGAVGLGQRPTSSTGASSLIGDVNGRRKMRQARSTRASCVEEISMSTKATMQGLAEKASIWW